VKTCKDAVLIFFVFLLGIVITACGRDDTQYQLEVKHPETLEDVLSIALTRREGITRPNHYRLAQLTEGRVPLAIEPIFFHIPRRTPVNDVSTADAIRDTDILFYALAGAYGPYIYFGGDEVFLPIRDDIIEALNAQPSWTRQDFALLLHAKLSQAINDRHFFIDGLLVAANYEFFTINRQFYLTENGFICQDNHLLVKEILLPCHPSINLDPFDIFRLSMDESGSSFFYVPVIAVHIRSDETEPSQLVIVYEDGMSETVPLITPETYFFERGGHWDDTYSTLDFMHNIPVVAVRRMGPPGRDGTIQFLSYAELLRGEPAVILDLRGNMGGYIRAVEEWFYTLTGQLIPTNFEILKLRSLEPFFSRLTTAVIDPYDDGRYMPFDDKHLIVQLSPERIVPSNQLIIVLVDRFTSSAAERMVDLTFNMENAIVIGHNTHGGTLTTVYEIYLLNSGIRISLGLTLTVSPGHFKESVGVAPDIWVTDCALTAALGMLENHFHHE